MSQRDTQAHLKLCYLKDSHTWRSDEVQELRYPQGTFGKIDKANSLWVHRMALTLRLSVRETLEKGASWNPQKGALSTQLLLTIAMYTNSLASLHFLIFQKKVRNMDFYVKIFSGWTLGRNAILFEHQWPNGTHQWSWCAWEILIWDHWSLFICVSQSVVLGPHASKSPHTPESAKIPVCSHEHSLLLFIVTTLVCMKLLTKWKGCLLNGEDICKW